jgi:hypothetical protein
MKNRANKPAVTTNEVEEEDEEEEEEVCRESSTDPESDWTLIYEDKTYTPVAEDVGSRLRIDVTAYSTADNSVLAGPIHVYTEPVLCSPGKPPRRGLVTIPGSGSGIAGAVRFRIVSYNILAELYATRQVAQQWYHIITWLNVSISVTISRLILMLICGIFHGHSVVRSYLKS